MGGLRISNNLAWQAILYGLGVLTIIGVGVSSGRRYRVRGLLKHTPGIITIIGFITLIASTLSLIVN